MSSEQPNVQDRDVGGTDVRKFRWNSDLAPLAREALIVNADNLNRCARAVSTCELSQDGIDSAVDGMSAFLTDTLAPFCEITMSAGDHPGVTINTHRHTTGSRNHSSIDRIHRPWFNDDLLNKRRIYLNALSIFKAILQVLIYKALYDKSYLGSKTTMTSGEWTCLILFATAPLTCSERGGSEKFKMKIYVSSGIRTHAPPVHDMKVAAP